MHLLFVKTFNVLPHIELHAGIPIEHRYIALTHSIPVVCEVIRYSDFQHIYLHICLDFFIEIMLI